MWDPEQTGSHVPKPSRERSDVDDSKPTSNPVTAPVTVGVAAIGPCVLWTGFLKPNGYGQRMVGGRVILAHRHAWALVHGDPGALCVCHRCDVRACINVAHLFLGTHADNMADMHAKGRRSHVGAKGERHGRAKLTDDQVREIRASLESQTVIARRLGVSQSNVSKIRSGKRWVHIL